MTIKKAWVILGIVTLITTAAAILKNKIAAVVLGPEGIGIYAQGIVFITFATTICTLGMGQGIVKHLAERQNNDVGGISRREIISNSLLIQFSVAVAIVSGVLLFRGSLANWLFGDVQNQGYVLIIAAAIPFTLLFSNFGYFLQGTGQIKGFSLATAANAIVGLVIFICLIQFFGLFGAIMSLVISASTASAIFVWTSRKKFLEIWRDSAILGVRRFSSQRIAKILLAYGVVVFVSGALESFNALILRSWIVNFSGAAQNGIYQAVVSMSGQYIGFFGLFNATYLLPKMSALKNKVEIGLETNKALQLGFLFLTPLLTILLIFREQIILILFTPAFLMASSIIVWQSLGDFAKVTSWSISASLLPTGRLKEFVLLSLLYSVLSLTLSLGFLYRWQTIGMAMAHFASYVLYLVVVIGVQKKVLRLRFSPTTLRLSVFSVLTLLSAALFPNQSPSDYIIRSAILCIWGVYSIREMWPYLQNLNATPFLSRFRA